MANKFFLGMYLVLFVQTIFLFREARKSRKKMAYVYGLSLLIFAVAAGLEAATIIGWLPV